LGEEGGRLIVGVGVGAGRDGWLFTGSLDVADDGTGLVLEELDANLGDTTTRSYRRAKKDGWSANC